MPRGVRQFQLPAASAGGRHFGKFLECLRLAADDEFRKIDVRNIGAAFGFVHVVRRDEQSDSARGKFEQQVPQVTASDRIDAGGGFVEEDHVGFVDQRTCQGQPLLPSARKRPRQLVNSTADPGKLLHVLRSLSEPFARQSVDPSVEFEVFADAEVGIQAELL